jgi:CheY-like chemotaxis protein
MQRAVSGHKILIVDDEQNITDTLTIIFNQCGYETRSAYSAEQAIDIIAEWQPDLALLDVMLPHMNGIDFAIVLQANYPACRILLFSGQPDSSELAEQATRKGHVFNILSKPIHPSFLLDMAANLLFDCPAPVPPKPQSLC